jgi:DNA-binding transcriptional MerR regulator
MKIINKKYLKINQTYTLKEISKECGVHIRTVQQWIHEGLQVIDKTTIPYLVYGKELKQFLIKKRLKARTTLGQNEFYCLKCRCGRESIPEKINYKYTDKVVGKNKLLVIISGVCKICRSRIKRISNDVKVKNFKREIMAPTQQITICTDNYNSYLDTDKEKY